jgi:hypothetical protein
MALSSGTNCGFVTVAPTADPAASDYAQDGASIGFRCTAPADLTISAIGWYCGQDTLGNGSNWEAGVYANDASLTGSAANTRPGARLYSATLNSRAASQTGWLQTALTCTINASTIYWIAIQLDAVAGSVGIDYKDTAGEKQAIRTSETALPTPSWGANSATRQALVGVYALYSTVTSAPVASAFVPCITIL